MQEIEPMDIEEKHYSPAQLANLWGLSTDTVRRRFSNEQGVVVLSSQKPGKRLYKSIRIPASVAERVHAELSLPKYKS